MTKGELASQLENAKNNYILGLAAISLFSNEKSQTILDESSANFGEYNIQFKQVSKLLQNDVDKKIAIKEFLTSQIRALIKESFELIKNYCTESNQLRIFKEKSWFHFARMIRNCLSHNLKFEFSPFDKRILPIEWKDKEITEDLEGENLTLEFFGYVETWELYSDFQNFVNTDLK